MTDDDFQAIVERGREARNTEFKAGGSIRDDHLLRRVIRSVLGMTNTQDGGRVILGVREQLGHAEFIGMTEAEAMSWNIDIFGDKSATWVDPAVSVDIEVKRHQGRYFVVVEVDEFDDKPVFARKGYQSPAGDMVLREGALYVRGSRKPETVEVRTSEEMRRLLELALNKRVSRFFQLADLAGLTPSVRQAPTDDELFDQQLQDFTT